MKPQVCPYIRDFPEIDLDNIRRYVWHPAELEENRDFFLDIPIHLFGKIPHQQLVPGLSKDYLMILKNMMAVHKRYTSMGQQFPQLVRTYYYHLYSPGTRSSAESQVPIWSLWVLEENFQSFLLKRVPHLRRSVAERSRWL